MSLVNVIEKLAILFTDCVREERLVMEEGHWNAQCTESFNVGRVHQALLRAQEVGCIGQLMEWLGQPEYTVDHEIDRIVRGGEL